MLFKSYTLRIALLFAGALSGLTCATGGKVPAAKTITGAIEQQDNATTFLRMLENAGGIEKLAGENKYAFVVPVDAAFNKIGFQKLLEIMSPTAMSEGTFLKGLVLTENPSPKDLAIGGTRATLDGKAIQVTAGSTPVFGGAPAIKTVKTPQGYVYFVRELPSL